MASPFTRVFKAKDNVSKLGWELHFEYDMRTFVHPKSDTFEMYNFIVVETPELIHFTCVIPAVLGTASSVNALAFFKPTDKTALSRLKHNHVIVNHYADVFMTVLSGAFVLA